eukprot:COSAG01_NODE_5892_length_3966_cov_2.409514_1_plen_115_part_00
MAPWLVALQAHVMQRPPSPTLVGPPSLAGDASRPIRAGIVWCGSAAERLATAQQRLALAGLLSARLGAGTTVSTNADVLQLVGSKSQGRDRQVGAWARCRGCRRHPGVGRPPGT